MRLRWLFGNFAEPDQPASRRKQREISRAAHEHHMPEGKLFRWTMLAIVLPAVLLLQLALPATLEHLGLSGRNVPYLAGIGIIILIVWVLSAFVYGHLYRRSVRRAMRDAGMAVCEECGYELDHLPASSTRCPECGHERGA